jgi:hypothetical protein
MGSPCKKHSGLFGLNKGVRGLALAAIVAAGLVEGRALGQGTPNDIGTVNPAHGVTVTLDGTNQYADSWRGQALPAGAPMRLVWNFNLDRIVSAEDNQGAISFTAGTNSVTNTSVFLLIDNTYWPTYNFTNNFVECGDLVDTLYGMVFPSQTLAGTDFKTFLHVLGDFSLANSDWGTINGPAGDSGHQLTGGVTNVVVNLAGRPTLSMSLNGTNTVFSYSDNNAMTGVFTLYSKTSDKLGVRGEWTAEPNAIESIYSVTNNGSVSIIDQFVIPFNPVLPQPLSAPAPTNQPPSGVFYMLSL